jgi:hypothetical protein
MRARARARACNARYVYGLGIGREEWSRIRWSFYRQGCNIVALAGERWRQLKPRNFLRIAIRREARAHPLLPPRFRPFVIVAAALSCGASRGDIYSRHGGVMPNGHRSEEEHCK